MKTTKTPRRVAIAFTVAITVLTLGGCMGDNQRANEPLPRMHKEKAQQWARHFTESMARSAQSQVSEDSVKPSFHSCVGENGEVAKDGRYTLDYYARSPLEVSKHSQGVKKIHDDLKQNGYRIDEYQESKGAKSAIILEASSPKHGFNLSVDGNYKHDSLLFSIHTPCLMPPGKKQQNY